MWNRITSIEDFPEEGEYVIETPEGDHLVAEMSLDGRWIFDNNDITESVCRYMEIGNE